MTTKPMFTPSKADPDAYDITAPGCIILSAAAAGGFKSSDLLETLLARGEVSERVKQLATKAADAAGHATVLGILREMKGQP